MNWDRIEGKWKQLTGHLKEQWGEFTNDPFDIIAGKREYLAGKVQESHGISREKMGELLTEWKKRMKDIEPVS